MADRHVHGRADGCKFRSLCICDHDGRFCEFRDANRLSMQHDGVRTWRLPVQRLFENRRTHEYYHVACSKHPDPQDLAVLVGENFANYK